MARRKYTMIDPRDNALCIRVTHRMWDRQDQELIEKEMKALAQKPDTLVIHDRDTRSTTLLHIPFHVRVKNFYAEMFGDNEEEDRVRDALEEAIVLHITDAT